MRTIEELVRPNILALTPYSSARDEFKGKGILMDANENPFGNLNRYPDPHQQKLKSKLALLKGVRPEQVFIGNGSDELIDLVFRIFCEPGRDKVLTFSPTYGMYQVSADINNVELINLPLNENFQVNFDLLESYIHDPLVKVIFLCSPNNPTGNTIMHIEKILGNFDGLIFIDEAYIDFSLEPSWLKKLGFYPRLLVSQTFSKAWALAAARIGVGYASDEIIRLLDKAKPPYNVSGLNQQAALKALRKKRKYRQNLQSILKEKLQLQERLIEFSFIQNVFPSDANFLLVRCDNADSLYEYLVHKKLITRNRNKVVDNCIRITVGRPEENRQLLSALKKFNGKNTLS